MRNVEKFINRGALSVYNLKPLQMFFVSMVFRIPYLIAYFPGLIIWDTASSIAQYYGIKTHVVLLSTNPDAILSNHHMILLTLLFGGAVKIGELIGSQNIGFFIYTLLQTAIINGIVVYGFVLLKEDARKIIYCIAFIAWLIIPVISLWQITACKDSLFTAFTILLIILLVQIVKTDGAVIKLRSFSVKLLFTSLMVILTKPQGAYVILFTFLIFCFAYRANWKKLLVTGIVPAVFYLTCFTNMILPALNVAVSGKQEALGFAFQQTAYYVSEYPTEITEEERANIDAILPFDQLHELYDPQVQDPVKFTYKQSATSEDLNKYISTWFKMFIKHPTAYFKATGANCSGFFVPKFHRNLSYMPVLIEYSDMLNMDNGFTLSNTKPYPIYNLISYIVEKLSLMTVTSIFYEIWFYVWSFVILTVILIYRNRKMLLSLIPAILCLALLIISPDVELRYALMFIYIWPLLLSSTFISSNQATSVDCELPK